MNSAICNYVLLHLSILGVDTDGIVKSFVGIQEVTGFNLTHSKEKVHLRGFRWQRQLILPRFLREKNG
jgi:hypothetical protein